VVGLSAPKSQFSEVDVEGYDSKPASIRVAEYALIVTAFEVCVAGVYDLVAVLA